VGQTIGNLIDVLLAAYLLRRLMRTGSPLQSVRGVALMLGAIAVGTAASALIDPSPPLPFPSHQQVWSARPGPARIGQYYWKAPD